MSVSVRSQQSKQGCHRETLLSWIVNTAWFTSVVTPHKTPHVHTHTHTHTSTEYTHNHRLSLLSLFFPWWSQDSPSGRALTIYRKGNLVLLLGTTQWHTYTSSLLTNRHTLLTNRNTQPLSPHFPSFLWNIHTVSPSVSQQALHITTSETQARLVRLPSYTVSSPRPSSGLLPLTTQSTTRHKQHTVNFTQNLRKILNPFPKRYIYKQKSQTQGYTHTHTHTQL